MSFDEIMKEQHWYCEECKHHGITLYMIGEDVWGVFQKLIIDHNKESPNCEFDRYKVKLIRG